MQKVVGVDSGADVHVSKKVVRFLCVTVMDGRHGMDMMLPVPERPKCMLPLPCSW